MSDSENKKKAPFLVRVAYILSPNILLSIFAFIQVIQGYLDIDKSGGWSGIVILICLPVLLISLVIDFIIKRILKRDILYIWVFELIIITIAFIIFLNLDLIG